MIVESKVNAFRGEFMGFRRKYSRVDYTSLLERDNYSLLIGPLQDFAHLCSQFLEVLAAEKPFKDEFKQFEEIYPEISMFSAKLEAKLNKLAPEPDPYTGLTTHQYYCRVKSADIVDRCKLISLYYENSQSFEVAYEEYKRTNAVNFLRLNGYD